MKLNSRLLFSYMLVLLSISYHDSSAQLIASVDTGVPGMAIVRTMAEYNGELYVAGVDGPNTSSYYVAKWDNQHWSIVAHSLDTSELSAASGIGKGIFSLAVFNGELYAGGAFGDIAGVPAHCLARWDGNSWHAVDTVKFSDINGFMEPIMFLTVMNGSLYAGGSFFRPINTIAKWDGSTWSAFGNPSGLGEIYGDVLGLMNHHDTMYAGGFLNFTNSSTITDAPFAFWDGNDWADDPLCPGFQFNCFGTDHNGNLYAADWTNINLYQYNSSGWVSLDPTGSLMDPIYSILEYNNKLYVGGWYQGAFCAGCQYLSVYDSSGWNTPYNGVQGWVEAMAEYTGDLYIGGIAMFVQPNLSANVVYLNDGLPGPHSNFSASRVINPTGSYVNFINRSKNATSYSWSFPGGMPSTDTSANPQNIYYDTEGDYDVILVTSDGVNSDTLIRHQAVIINTFSTGQQYVKSEPILNLYPSPATNSLNIECSNFVNNLQVFSVDGNCLINSEVNNFNFHQDLKGLPPGCFYIRISGNDFNLTKKLIHF